MVASAGDALAKEKIANDFKKYLLKNSLLVTPNVSEAEKLSEMKIENANVDKYLDDNFGNENKKYKKQLTCTKCKGTNFEDQSELRQHYKTNWHKHNALLSAQGKESMSAEEYDEYVLMNPEALN